MSIRTVILDFDGTCTDVEREAQGFLVAFKAELARVIGVDDIEAVWREKQAEVLRDPSRYGMVFDGKLVAPPVDLYLLSTAVALLIAPNLDDATSERLFTENYRFTSTHFKPEARAVLEALSQANVFLFVVTNSSPSAVAAKLEALAPAGLADIRLYGGARKFLVEQPALFPGDVRFGTVPETLELAAWKRPVYPRRGHYFDALASIWQETQTTPQETLVVGDVFELDLLLPAMLGCALQRIVRARQGISDRRDARIGVSFGCDD